MTLEDLARWGYTNPSTFIWSDGRRYNAGPDQMWCFGCGWCLLCLDKLEVDDGRIVSCENKHTDQMRQQVNAAYNGEFTDD